MATEDVGVGAVGVCREDGFGGGTGRRTGESEEVVFPGVVPLLLGPFLFCCCCCCCCLCHTGLISLDVRGEQPLFLLFPGPRLNLGEFVEAISDVELLLFFLLEALTFVATPLLPLLLRGEDEVLQGDLAL